MANEYLLKMIANGLQGLAADHGTLYDFLNLRAALHGAARFTPAQFVPPVPPYADKATSSAAAADLIESIADSSAFLATYLGGTPAAADGGTTVTDEADLLRLILDWGTIVAGAFRAIVQLYGLPPAPIPGLPNPGPASEERLWAEKVAWLTKIATDANSFLGVQAFPGTVPSSGAGSAGAVARLEQGVRRTTLNTLQIAGRLPYHLYHAAHPATQSSP